MGRHARTRRAMMGALAILAAAAACGTSQPTATTGQAPEPVPTVVTSTPVEPTRSTLPKDGGVVVDPYGRPVAGATVTLFSAPDPKGPFTPVPAGSAVMNPANRKNPVVTGPDGSFRWDILAGIYQIRATKEGCRNKFGDEDEARTSWFRTPPTYDEFELVLDCRPPDSNPPHIRIDARPPAVGNGSSVRIAFTVTDASPFVVYCVLGGSPYEPDQPFGPPCTSPYVLNGLGRGAHEVTIVAFDDRGNPSAEEITFRVG